MRRVLLLALFALALPAAALADSIDFNLNGGTMSLTPNSASVSAGVSAAPKSSVFTLNDRVAIG